MKKKLVAFLSAAVIGLSLVPGSSTFATETKAAETKAADSKADSKSKLPEMKTTPISEEEADKALKASMEKIKELKNFEMKLNADMDMEGMAMSFKGDGIIDIANKAMTFQMNLMGQDFKMFVKDGKSYSYSGNAWTVTNADPKTFEQFGDTSKMTPADTAKFLKVFEAGKTEDGSIVFKNKEAITEKTFKEMMPESDAKSSNAAMMDQFTKGENMAMDMMMVLDKDNNFKQVVIAMDVKENEAPMKLLLTLDMENINAAKEIVVPQEALDADKKGSDKPATEEKKEEATTKAN